MKNYSDEQILKGILRHDNLILQYIYKQFYYQVNYLLKRILGMKMMQTIFFRRR
jgi:hypothetical protein